MIEDDEFSNPELLPAEQLSIQVKTDGVVRTIKALDPYWVEKRDWSIYRRLPTDNGVVGALDAWNLNANDVLDDLKFLLALKHHRFWSHMIFEPRCTELAVSFLQEADPSYAAAASPPPVYQLIRSRVANLMCRLVTERERDTEWMTREYLGVVIYDRYLVSVPALWDVCLLYGADNAQPVSRMLRAAFALQPKYTRDLETAVTFVQEVFKYAICQVNKRCDGSLEPPNLPETFKGFGEIHRPEQDGGPFDKLTPSVLGDLIVHLLDSALTIRLFTELYPPAVEVLKKRGFILSVAQLYESAIPSMYEHLDALAQAEPRVLPLANDRLEMLRGELIDVTREILAAETDAILSQKGDKEQHVADYFSSMMDLLSEKTLVRDYNSAYPVHDDLEMLCQAYPQMDSVKIDFILQAVYSNLDEEEIVLMQASELAHGRNNVETYEEPQSEPANGQTEIEVEIPSNIKEESLISEVKDILPHLGEGFILKCLQHYGFNAERVINGVLEGTLDESLKSLDQSLPIIPPDKLDETFLRTGLDRLNVFDGDEFDVMTRDSVDLSRVHRGKRREKYRDLREMLNDKSALKQRMDIYSKYSLVTEDENMYSDEYDDTYDSAGVAAAEPSDARRPLVRPRVLQQAEREEESSEEEVEPAAEAEVRTGRSGAPLDFCVNPELVRERREAARRANQKPARTQPKSGDVVGKAKGQGQEKEVLVNRDKKSQNKSSRANHNRRQGAQWKRSQGMMPS